MAHDDFDIDSLAVYLHLTPQQVARLADRGKLPGRKVTGQWRFSQGEVHHWLENRIGLSDEEELVAMETALQRASPADEQDDIRISDLLPREAVAVPLPARTRNSVITSMVALAAQTGWLWDPDRMDDAVRSREEMHSTALENGVALLHPRRPMTSILDRAFLALGVTSTPIPFGSGAPPSDVFFLICSLEDRGHLRVLARLSRLLTLPDFIQRLRNADDEEVALALIRESDTRLA